MNNRAINERAWLLAGQSKAYPILLAERLPIQLGLPLLFASFLGYDYYTRSQEYYSKNCHANSQNKGEFFEKICGQPHGYNRLAQVRNHFVNKFSTCFSNDYHQNKFSIGVDICQGKIDPCLTGRQATPILMCHPRESGDLKETDSRFHGNDNKERGNDNKERGNDRKVRGNDRKEEIR